jgi:NOL1/NOP2/sun family putative RNA methylase
MSKTPEQKRALWLERTAQALNIDAAAAEALLRTPRRQSLRINTLKADVPATLSMLRSLGWQGEAYSWMQTGYTMGSPFEIIRDSELVHDGRVFIQNAASWLPVLALDVQQGDHILDVCAAPGGKTSHIMAVSNGKARVWANDNSRARLAKLQSNLERLGADVERLCLYDATNLVRKLGNEQFDKILLDAPCSGEGLMQLDSDKDLSMWSVAQVKRLSQLQRRILTQAWQLLKPGGTLVYSTCTMAPEENEAVVDYLLRSREDARIVPFDLQVPNRVPTVAAWNNKAFSTETRGCMRLKPSQNIEAFFVCKLQKVASDDQ